MQTEAGEQGASNRVDLVMAVIIVALGLATFYFSYTMPRLENRGVHPSTIPGLVPMLLGGALVVLGGMLGWQAWRARTPEGWRDLAGLFRTRVAARVATAVALVLIYTLALIGSMPFWAASGLFIVAFILAFEVFLSDAPVPFLRSLLWAVFTAAVFGGGIYYVFTDIFLVRLP